MAKTTWRKKLVKAFWDDDSWNTVEHVSIPDNELDQVFDDEYDRPKAFTLWTKSRVYFSATTHDGLCIVQSISRHPAKGEA